MARRVKNQKKKKRCHRDTLSNNGEMLRPGDEEGGRGWWLNQGGLESLQPHISSRRVPVLLGPGNIITIFFA